MNDILGGRVMKFNIRKLTTAGLLVALSVCLSTFAIPIGASKCFPIQHLVNVLAGVFLGPVYGGAMAFCTSLIRNLMGTGSLLAFPGSMVGAILCGICYQKTRHMAAAYAGEVIGTGILGAMLCFPVATWIMGKEAALFTYVIPFMLSTVCGTCIAVVLLTALQKAKVLELLKENLAERRPAGKSAGRL